MRIARSRPIRIEGIPWSAPRGFQGWCDQPNRSGLAQPAAVLPHHYQESRGLPVHTMASRRGHSRRSGFSLLEMVVAAPIVLIALSLFVQMLDAGLKLRQTVREEWAASSRAQDILEQMRNEDLGDVVVLFNADPFDDPNGPGTAPGDRFDVEGLRAFANDPAGMVGTIELPIWNAGSEVAPDWRVREDLVNDELGTPRDLNGDCIVDALDHSGDYTILPVVIRLRWEGRHGRREFRLYSALTEIRQ